MGTIQPRVRRTASNSTMINRVPKTMSIWDGLPCLSTCSARWKWTPNSSKSISYQVMPIYSEAAIPMTISSQSQAGTLAHRHQVLGCSDWVFAVRYIGKAI